MLEKKSVTLVNEVGLEIGLSSQGETLLEFLIQGKVSWDHSCGGMGTCGTCRVEILNSEILAAPNEIEAEMIQDRNFSKNERLTCQIEPITGMRIKIRN